MPQSFFSKGRVDRIADVLYDLAFGRPRVKKGVAMSDVTPEPTAPAPDAAALAAENEQLKAQLAEAQAANGAATTTDEAAKPAEDRPAVESGEPDKSGPDILAEARAKLEAGEELDALHVRALEHPEEFAE